MLELGTVALGVMNLNVYCDLEQHEGFFKTIQSAFSVLDYKVSAFANTKAAWKRGVGSQDYSIFVGRPSKSENSLQAIPLLGSRYWAIEGRKNPWETDLAKAIFEPEKYSENEAYKKFNEVKEQVLSIQEFLYSIDDFVLIILDDDLGKSEFRPMSSFDMIEQVLGYESERQILVKRPDGVEFGKGQEARLLELDRHNQISFTNGHIDRLLEACSYVVSQTSEYALRATLFRKPALQMGQCAFHHILRNPERDGRILKSFNRMDRDRAPFERYVAWLVDERAVDLEDQDAGLQIINRCQQLGW